MLYQELPRIESSPLDKWERLLPSLVIAVAGITAAIVLLLVHQRLAAGLALFCGAGFAARLSLRRTVSEAPAEPLAAGPDYALAGSTLGLCADPVALTDADGALLIANHAYRRRFGSSTPQQLPANED
ncbi:MAG TPA: hypothetical protein VJ846_08950, partial [Sphingomicrobium sp.]|nr:hypothetical protein [Sphingomicrobium sp.]